MMQKVSSNTQKSIITNTGKDLKDLMVGSCTSAKKYIGRLQCGTICYRTAWMWDLNCATFQKVKMLGQVGCRTCNIGSYKWLYKNL